MDVGNDRIVLVTGASTGIGRSTALMLADKGFHVFAGVRKDIDGDRLIKSAGRNLTPLTLDVTNQEHITQALKTVTEAAGEQGLYGLVNNAGISIACPLEYTSREDWQKTFDVNVFGLGQMISAFLPLLRKGQGRIVNVSSGAGRLATPIVGAYSGSKFAVEGISDALRIELRGSGVSVSVVEPGMIKTDIHRKMDDGVEEVLARLPEEGANLYTSAVKSFMASGHKLEAKAPGPELVASVITKALLSKKAKSRYTAGKDAALLGVASRFLPDAVKDAIFATVIGK